MKTINPDVKLIKDAMNREALAIKVCRILRKLPHNRPEKYRDATRPASASSERAKTLCLLLSQFNGKLNHHETLEDQKAWLDHYVKYELTDEEQKAAERVLASVQWRLQRRGDAQRHCLHSRASPGTRCCNCKQTVADPQAGCDAPAEPQPVL